MFEILNLLKPVLLVIFALAIVLGLMSPKKLPKILAMWILGPLLFAIGIGYFKSFFSQTNSWQQLLIIAVGAFVVIVIGARLIFGKGIYHAVAGEFIYDVLKSVILLPFRILHGIGRIFSRRR